MADMVLVLKSAFGSIMERKRNFIYGALWSIALSLALSAVFMVMYYGSIFASFGAFSLSGAEAGNASSFLVMLAVVYAVFILLALLTNPLTVVATMLYSKASLEGRDIGFVDFISAVKEKYIRLLLASLFVVIVCIAIALLLCLVLGGLSYIVYMLLGSSSVLLTLMLIIAAIVFAAVMVAFSLLAMLYTPYVFSRQTLDRGIVGSFMYSINLAKARIWDMVALILMMIVIGIAIIIISLILSIPLLCLGPLFAVPSLIGSFVISYVMAYALLYLVKDAA